MTTVLPQTRPRLGSAAPPAPETGRPPSIELRQIRKAFGGVVAVDGISLSVAPGEFLTLLGPSGCGKTTTLRMIGGFELPDSGEVAIDGAPMGHRPPYQRPVNTVFQNYALFPHLTVAQNVGYGLEMAGVPKRQRAERVTAALAMVHLPGVEHRRPSELSGGQQQRVALARALINRPAVLLLDEPLGALDLKLRKAMQFELKRLNREVGATFVYVTHDQEEALTMSDRIAVMNQGRILQLGPPAEIYERPRDRFVADFIGQTNFLDVTLLAIDDRDAIVDFAGVGPLRARVPADLAPVPQPGARTTLAVRPEKISLAADLPATPPGWNHITAVVADVVYLGTHTHYLLALPDGATLTIHRQNRSPTPPDLAPGTPTQATFAPEAATILQD